ncbi:RHS repeat protein [Flavobacterium branchiicola]|uniref:RHS repeat domain-containing protein n=1 Tax=Flavobacterium branchiicola TaxID=1114875 RepID=A0ABV9PJG2_9FLAO|nr:RHS repeat domain-containing protein [Flavobacterium branchiicola]MBS7256715.1 RHS repeat protein [Flavobacterium branchiicola]
MIKYTDAPINISGGRPDVTVPIYTVSEPGISFPIAFNYGSGGVKVDEVASSYGLGWNLIAGGSITRVVRGIMDESAPKKSKTDFSNISTLIGAASSVDIGTLRHAKGITDLSFGCDYFQVKGFNKYSGGSTPYDLEPDVFYFNFNGYSGKFIFENGVGSDNTAPVFFPRRKDIKITKVLGTEKLYPNKSVDRTIIKEWVLTTPDGIEYYFGQNNLKETNFNYAYNTDDLLYKKEEVTGWFLTRIYNPITKAEVTFNYNQHNYSYEYTTDEVYSRAQNNYDLCAKEAFLNGLLLQSNLSRASVKTFVLSEINTSKLKISFNGTANREDVDKYNVFTSETYDNAKVLDKIEIFDKWHNKILKKYNLNYSYFLSNMTVSSYLPAYTASNDHKRLRLNSITELNINNETLPSYVFTYNDENTLTLPRRLSFARDKWGFYNGALGNVRLLPSCQSPANRNSDPTNAKAFMLKTVQYPTGGTHSFLYGYNAGLRLEKVSIKDINSNTLIENSYSYDQGTLLNVTNDYVFSAASAADITLVGTITNNKCQTEIWAAGTGYYNNTHYLQAYPSYIPPTGIDYKPLNILSSAPILSSQVPNFSSPIYGYVTVTNLENNVAKGKKEYAFNRPSNLASLDKYPSIPEENSLYGKPIYERTYDANNTLLKSEDFEYEENSDSRIIKGTAFSTVKCYINNSSSENFTSDMLFYRFYNLTSKSYLLKKKTTTEYLNGQSFINTENYQYTASNISDLPTSISRSESGGSSIVESKTYSGQSNGSNGYITDLYNANRLQELVSSSTTKNGNTVNSARKDFKTFSGNTMPSEIFSSKGNYALESKLTFTYYDEKGNPLEYYKTTDGQKTVLIWGYNKEYPIAEIKAKTITYAFFNSYASNLQNLSNLDIDVTSEENLRTALNNLRVTFPNDMITTYTYDPNKGITSITDPTGKTIYYTYDLFGRLQFVKDAQGNLLSENQYNYKN